MWHNYGSVLTSALHGKNTWEDLGPEPVICKPGEGDLCGVLPQLTELSGMFGGGMPGDGSHNEKDTGVLHVKALTGPCGNFVVGTATIYILTEMRHEIASGIAFTSPMNGQVQLSNGDDTEGEIRGSG